MLHVTYLPCPKSASEQLLCLVSYFNKFVDFLFHVDFSVVYLMSIVGTGSEPLYYVIGWYRLANESM